MIMSDPMPSRHLLIFIAVIILVLVQGCGDDLNVNGVNSPGPGILRVILKSDENDNFLVVGGDTVWVQEGSTDSLAMAVGQGRAYRGVDYAVLYKTLQDYQEVTKYCNPIRRVNGAYVDCVLFETELPPATFDSLKINLTANMIKIGPYTIPLTPTTDASEFVIFTDSFRIEEGRTTVVRLQLKPFASLQRVEDTYQYHWVITVSKIEYQ
jgi:hypothetical protein